mmetsp:Transcript_9216/g.26327  ORF Transcript_9216/g.26327 Transcript_9216/m.26327 type:complete len:202 (+) Transcript_9216:5752-6357(+)
MLLQVLAVRVEGMIFNQFRQMVRRIFGPCVHEDDVPIVKECHRLCQHTIDDALITTQRFHDEEMVQFIIGLGVMRAHLVTQIAFTERFTQVHDAQVGKVGHACDRFEDEETRKVAFRAAHGIKEANEFVDRVDDDLVEGEDAFVHLVGDLLLDVLDGLRDGGRGGGCFCDGRGGGGSGFVEDGLVGRWFRGEEGAATTGRC